MLPLKATYVWRNASVQDSCYHIRCSATCHSEDCATVNTHIASRLTNLTRRKSCWLATRKSVFQNAIQSGFLQKFDVLPQIIPCEDTDVFFSFGLFKACPLEHQEINFTVNYAWLVEMQCMECHALYNSTCYIYELKLNWNLFSTTTTTTTTL